ncbi:hypothetical protein AX15_000517 [Amanita polypyramis BW_CC]|nr:hypothetical protein AX15_000517 [Amanita polypyramis BW_CC]
MAYLHEAYAPAIAFEGWNYVRYTGPFSSPQTEPLYLCVKRGELVVATGREASKLWYINRWRAPDDNVNRHACSFKREGTQTYICYRFPFPERKGEALLGPKMRFDVLRVRRMQRPCYIQVHQDLCVPDECCEERPREADPNGDAPMEVDAPEEEKPKLKGPPRPPIDWYLGVSEDLKVVLKPFLPAPGSSGNLASERPIWELTTREEAIREDYPSPPPAPAWDPRMANNPMRREYYTHPNRIKLYDRDFWPPNSRPE